MLVEVIEQVRYRPLDLALIDRHLHRVAVGQHQVDLRFILPIEQFLSPLKTQMLEHQVAHLLGEVFLHIGVDGGKEAVVDAEHLFRLGGIELLGGGKGEAAGGEEHIDLLQIGQQFQHGGAVAAYQLRYPGDVDEVTHVEDQVEGELLQHLDFADVVALGDVAQDDIADILLQRQNIAGPVLIFEHLRKAALVEIASQERFDSFEHRGKIKRIDVLAVEIGQNRAVAVVEVFPEGEGKDLQRHLAAGEQGGQLPGEERRGGAGDHKLELLVLLVMGAQPFLKAGDFLDLVEKQVDSSLQSMHLAVGLVDLIEGLQRLFPTQTIILQIHEEDIFRGRALLQQLIDRQFEQAALPGAADALQHRNLPPSGQFHDLPAIARPENQLVGAVVLPVRVVLGE